MEFKYNLESNIRLDQFLKNNIPNVSREKIKSSIKKGLVKVDDIIVKKPSFIISNNNIVFIDFEEEDFDIKLIPWNNFDILDVIFENDDYLIINKPSGLMVHPGIGNYDKTLVNILLFKEYNLSKKDTNRPGIVHRLDKNTSGVLIIAKNDVFHDYISKQFMSGEIIKIYELITDGKYNKSKGIVDVPIGRDQNNKKLMKATLQNSKPAKSIFRVIESFKNNEYVEFKILTGRTHQIRVHSKFLGAPIFNDLEYSKNILDKEFGQFLHAKKISFIDLDGKRKEYEADLPEKITKKLKELRALK